MITAERPKDGNAERRLMALLAHELRNPLMPLRTATMALGHMDQSDPRLPWARAVIERQVKIIADLVQVLGEISTLSGQRLERNPHASLARACSAALTPARDYAAENNVRIAIDQPIPDATVRFQAPALERVIGILLRYAINRTAPGDEVTFAARIDAKAAMVIVREAHNGLSALEKASIFDLHRGPNEPDTTHGVRLSLHLAARLTERYRARLRCHSEGLGRGSELELRIPFASNL